MIIFHDNGKITGYQNFPATYSGPLSYVEAQDGTALTNKKIVGGALVSMTQQEIDDEAAASAAAALVAWRGTCEVTRRQALIALYNAGDLAMVEAAVAQAGGVTQIEWDNALTFRRMNTTALALGQALGWTEAQLDTLFQAAEQVGD